MGSVAAVSSPLCSSKLKAWTGLRKSSTLARGALASGSRGLAGGVDFIGLAVLID